MVVQRLDCLDSHRYWFTAVYRVTDVALGNVNCGGFSHIAPSCMQMILASILTKEDWLANMIALALPPSGT